MTDTTHTHTRKHRPTPLHFRAVGPYRPRALMGWLPIIRQPWRGFFVVVFVLFLIWLDHLRTHSWPLTSHQKTCVHKTEEKVGPPISRMCKVISGLSLFAFFFLFLGVCSGLGNSQMHTAKTTHTYNTPAGRSTWDGVRRYFYSQHISIQKEKKEAVNIKTSVGICSSAPRKMRNILRHLEHA